MADLLSQLQSILSTEEGQAGLKQVAQMLGATGTPAPATPPPPTPQTPPVAPAPPSPVPPVTGPSAPPTPANESMAGGLGDLLSGLDLSALSQMFSQMQAPAGAPPPPSGASSASATSDATQTAGGFDLSGIDLGMIMKVQQMVQGMSHEDENIRLLRSLKPHLSESRQKKVEQAIQLLRLYTLLPVIKETGLLGGLLGDAKQRIEP